MKLLRIGLAWLALCGAAYGQAQVGAGQVLGNSTAALRPARAETVTAILDRALGSTRGAILERGASGWAIVGPGTAGLPWVSAGAGADALYGIAAVIGGGTGINVYAIGDIICATGTTTLSRIADIATGNVLLAGGVGACPAYGKVTSAHITAAALTRVDDTNVTLTLGGAPTTALVNAASLTLGWSGTLAVARGGTGGGAASGTLLDNITGFASTGYIRRTGAGTYAFSSAASGAQYLAGTATNVPVEPSVLYQAEVDLGNSGSGTQTIDFSTFINARTTMTGNITTQTLSNVTAGKAGTITFIQDGTGTRTTVWSTVFKFAGGTLPVLSTAINTVDVLSYSCRSATFCVASLIKDVRNP
jgi:hypothetical protein